MFSSPRNPNNGTIMPQRQVLSLFNQGYTFSFHYKTDLDILARVFIPLQLNNSLYCLSNRFLTCKPSCHILFIQAESRYIQGRHCIENACVNRSRQIDFSLLFKALISSNQFQKVPNANEQESDQNRNPLGMEKKNFCCTSVFSLCILEIHLYNEHSWGPKNIGRP